MDHIAKALAGHIWNNRDTVGNEGLSINGVCLEIGLSLKEVVPWNPAILYLSHCPLITIGDIALTNVGWDAAPWVMQESYQTEIMAYLPYDDTPNNARAIQRMTRAIRGVFMGDQFDDIPLEFEPTEQVMPGSTGVIYNLGEPYIRSAKVEYEEVADGSGFMRVAILEWQGYANRQVQ